MKISTLLERLGELQGEHGDIEVKVGNEWGNEDIYRVDFEYDYGRLYSRKEIPDKIIVIE
jgi:hypothetical protein